LRVDGRPIFVIYRPAELPNVTSFIREWQELAVQCGLPGLHFVAHLFHNESAWDYRSQGFDSCVVVSTFKVFSLSLREWLLGIRSNGSQRNLRHYRTGANGDLLTGALCHGLWRRYRSMLGQFSNVRLYRHVLPFLLDGCSEHPQVYPCVTPNWDNTARSNVRGVVLHESTPELFRPHLRAALKLVHSRPMDQRLVFVKSWNEWAEGNYLEPDQKFGHDYLKIIREEISVS
jgi:hypothetical protein